MELLKLAFIGIYVYSIVTTNLGGAILGLSMYLFVLYGDYYMTHRDSNPESKSTTVNSKLD